MNVYITEVNKEDMHFMAIAINGNILKKDIDESVTNKDILKEALCEVKQYITQHPSCYDNKEMTIYQDTEKSYNETAWKMAQEIRSIWGSSGSKNVVLQTFNPLSEQLALKAIEKNKAYQFAEGDIIIAKRPQRDDETKEQAERNSKEFSLCARVVSVDHKKDELILDKYLSCGKVSCSPQPMSLLETELYGYYRPMNKQELLDFRDGLTKLLCDPIKSQRLDTPYITFDTFERVNILAEHIERRQKDSMTKEKE